MKFFSFHRRLLAVLLLSTSASSSTVGQRLRVVESEPLPLSAFARVQPASIIAGGACKDPNHLQQSVLVILRFPSADELGALTPTEQQHILDQLQNSRAFFWNHSGETIDVNYQIVLLPGRLKPNDYERWGSQAAARYTPGVHRELLERGIDPGQYAGLLMIYRPTEAPGDLINNTWIWYDKHVGNKKLNPGFSSIVFNSSQFLGEVIVHEYLHQVDHRFEHEAKNPEPGQRGFMNPDHKDEPDGLRLAELLSWPFPPFNATQNFDTLEAYYRAILRYYVRGDSYLAIVNYGWLDGVRGNYTGVKPKLSYDFSVLDDRLIHRRGDDISFVRISSNPASFWFRARPRQQASFATRTIYGRHILKSLSFNYEIAPEDYTFKVYLEACNELTGKQPWRVRLDDGIYTLGRQLFERNRKVIKPERVAEDFRIIFEKGNDLSDPAAHDDWLLLGRIEVSIDAAP